MNWFCFIISFHPVPSTYPVLSVTWSLNFQCNLYLCSSVKTSKVKGYKTVFAISNFTQLENYLIRMAQLSAGVILRSSAICCSVNMVLSSKKNIGPFLIPHNDTLFFKISWKCVHIHIFIMHSGGVMSQIHQMGWVKVYVK